MPLFIILTFLICISMLFSKFINLPYCSLSEKVLVSVKRERKRDGYFFFPGQDAVFLLELSPCFVSVCICDVQFFPSPDGLLHHMTSELHLQVQAMCAASIQVAASYVLKL